MDSSIFSTDFEKSSEFRPSLTLSSECRLNCSHVLTVVSNVSSNNLYASIAQK